MISGSSTGSFEASLGMAANAAVPRRSARSVGSYRAAQVGVIPLPVPVPWKPNSVDCPAATDPL